MTKLEIFNKLMIKAKSNGYDGNDYKLQNGFILDGTNYYSLIFREDFAKAIWGEEESCLKLTSTKNIPNWKFVLYNLLNSKDKWKFLEEIVILF